MNQRCRIGLSILLIAQGLARSGWGQTEATMAGAARAANRATATAWTLARQAEVGADSNRLVRTGLIADRADRRVDVLVEATGIEADQPVEFVLIGEASGHGYESLFVSLARAADVDEALRFIGLPRGAPMRQARLRFHPRGERVRAAFLLEPDPAAPVREQPVAEALTAARGGDAATLAGAFVFTGSVTDDAGAYAADAVEPHAIIATYNETSTVLDVPYRAPQGRVYGTLNARGLPGLTAGRLLMLRLRAAQPAGVTGMVDLAITVSGDTNGAPVYGVSGPAGAVRLDDAPLAPRLLPLAKTGQDLYVTARFDAALPLTALARASARLAEAEDAGVNIEPPPAGEPYYRAFIPEPRHRSRADRPSQPIELSLTRRADGGVDGVIGVVAETWAEGAATATLTVSEHPVATPDGLPAALRAHDNPLPVLLVFAAPDLRYGELMAWLGPVMATHSTLYIFAGAPTP